MGQEIDVSHFSDADFARFEQQLKTETEQLQGWFKEGALANQPLKIGFELEAWLLDNELAPAAINDTFIQQLNNPNITPELARFNIEINSQPLPLTQNSLSQLEQQLEHRWQQCHQQARRMNAHLLMSGTLPNLQRSDLNPRNMSSLKRYHALNEQVFHARAEQPLQIDIQGHERLQTQQSNVMLEAATTSFQTHLQVPLTQAHRYYNASIIASAPLVAACANSPYLFGKQLWHETRIPLFEQAINVGGYADAAHGPLHRVGFGSGFAYHSLMECFTENQQHFPVLLPLNLEDDPQPLPHLRLHNGTLWRWNRPLLGFDQQGVPHLRIEQRILPSGPSLCDNIANAAFYYGLTHYLSQHETLPESQLEFARCRDNFYHAARNGLQTQVVWLDGQHHNLRRLILDELLPLARQGLFDLNLHQRDISHYLGIIEARVENQQTGAVWQQNYVQRHGRDMQRLTRACLSRQNQAKPVHLWSL
ncbi:MAG: glutamate--cysteine ligase [Gammaproteobacteria bacterium]|nr:glutamate--cysteine ligase [Gammaproteobacteria bacterium]